MKVFFDTNVYIAEALLGTMAETLIDSTIRARWRVFVNGHVLEEVERVMIEQLDCTPRFASLTRQHCRRRAIVVTEPESRHEVHADQADSPILRAALDAGTDYLVSNDKHLLALSPYEGLRILTMSEYYELLKKRRTFVVELPPRAHCVLPRRVGAARARRTALGSVGRS